MNTTKKILFYCCCCCWKESVIYKKEYTFQFAETPIDIWYFDIFQYKTKMVEVTGK